MLRCSFPEAVIGDVVQHFDWSDGGCAGRRELALHAHKRRLYKV